jgi:hypothetical protein
VDRAVGAAEGGAMAQQSAKRELNVWMLPDANRG